MITSFLNGQIQADSSHFIRLFLTKYKKWEYQNESRFIGCANEKPKFPKIKCIYLGKRISKENEEAIIKFALNHNIEIKYN